MSSQLLLRWDNHESVFARSMRECLCDQELCDLTIACQGRSLQCHKLILSAASRFIKLILKDNPAPHPIIIMRDVPYTDMQSLLLFIYHGEVAVSENDLTSFLQTARALEVRGLADDLQQDMSGSVTAASAAADMKTPLLTSSASEPVGGQHQLQMTSRLEPEVVVDETNDAAPLKLNSVSSSESSLNNVDSALPPLSSALLNNTATTEQAVVKDDDDDDDEGDEGQQLKNDPDSRSRGPPSLHVPGVSPLLDGILRRAVQLPERGLFCPYCPREVSMRTLGKHITKVHGGQRLQCRACHEVVHTRVTSPLIHHGVCVLLQHKQPRLTEQTVRRLSRLIRGIYKNRRLKSQMLRRYPDLAYFCSSFIFGRVKQACPRCDLVLWSSSMTSHLEKCGEDVVQCDFCNKHMARTRLPFHIDIYHPGKAAAQQQLSSDQSPEKAELSLEVDDVQLHHPVFSTSLNVEEDVVEMSDTERVEAAVAAAAVAAGVVKAGPATIVACPQCGKKMRQNNLRRHIRVMHSHRQSSVSLSAVDNGARRQSLPVPLKATLTSSSTSGRLSDSASSSSSVAVDKYAQYKGTCHLCGKVMWRKYLNSHMRSAHGESLDDSTSVADAAAASIPPPPALQQYEPLTNSLASSFLEQMSSAGSTPSKSKVLRHCPFCWKTMWRCNVKRHIRVMHADLKHRLTASFDLLAEIRAAADQRRVPVPEYALASSSTAGAGDDFNDDGGVGAVAATSIATDEDEVARLAILEMDAMAEAEGMEAAAVVTVDEAVQRSERVATDTRRHEKHLKRCPFCRKLVRGCHLKRHILNWHRSVASSSYGTVGSTAAAADSMSPSVSAQAPRMAGSSTKTGVPGGLNPARQRTCPICLKVVVVNNLRRHIRASHPDVSEEELANYTKFWVAKAAGFPETVGGENLGGGLSVIPVSRLSNEMCVKREEGESTELHNYLKQEDDDSVEELKNDEDAGDEFGEDMEDLADISHDQLEGDVSYSCDEVDEDEEDDDAATKSDGMPVDDAGGSNLHLRRVPSSSSSGGGNRRLRCCLICNKLMATGNMSRHMRTHHPETKNTKSAEQDLHVDDEDEVLQDSEDRDDDDDDDEDIESPPVLESQEFIDDDDDEDE